MDSNIFNAAFNHRRRCEILDVEPPQTKSTPNEVISHLSVFLVCLLLFFFYFKLETPLSKSDASQLRLMCLFLQSGARYFHSPLFYSDQTEANLKTRLLILWGRDVEELELAGLSASRASSACVLKKKVAPSQTCK